MSALLRGLLLVVGLLCGTLRAQEATSFRNGISPPRDLPAQYQPLHTSRGMDDRARLLPPQPVRTLSTEPDALDRRHIEAIRPVAYDQPLPITEAAAPMPLRIAPAPERQARTSSNATSGTRATTTVIGSLIVVLAVFFLLVWVSRKTAPKGMAPLPSEVLESLGRATLTARQQLQLIRLGNKLLLLSITPTGAETLAEITDAEEVQRLAGLCQQHRAGSISDSFRQVLSQYAHEPTAPGFLGEPVAKSASNSRRASSRVRYEEHDRG